MSSVVWNLFNALTGTKFGECDGGPTREDVERVAREELGYKDAEADLKRCCDKCDKEDWGRLEKP